MVVGGGGGGGGGDGEGFEERTVVANRVGLLFGRVWIKVNELGLHG